MGRSSLWRVPVDHFRTLYDNRTGRPDLGAWCGQLALPAGGGVLSWLLGAHLDDVSGAIAGVSVVTGLLFSMSIFLFQLRVNLPDDDRFTAKDTVLLDECMANTLWAITWGLALTLFLVVTGAGGWTGTGSWAAPLTGVAVGAALHFLVVIMMCVKRLRRAYERIAMHRP